MMSTVAVAMATLSIGPAAFAADTSGAPSVKVSYRDLDPGQPRDAARLLHRFENAAMEACGASTDSLTEYRNSVRHSVCVHDGMARAVAALNAPVVTNLFEAQASAVTLASN